MISKAEIVQVIMELVYGKGSDEEDSRLMDRLNSELPHCNISDLIFWHDRDLTPEQVADEALRIEAEHASGDA